MAAYEKQQPQPSQPPAHLNAAYYGPPIPPQQPAYYGPPSAGPRRMQQSGARCFFCFLFKIIALAIIALGAATFVLWLVFRPGNVRAYADSAALSRFDLPGGGGLLQYNLTVAIRVRNPNRFGISYDYAEAQAHYEGDRFGFAPLQPFYLDGKSDGRITATFNGATVVVDDDVRRTYRRETGQGFYYVKVKVYADNRYKVRIFNVHRRSKISCLLRLPVPAAGDASSAAMTTLGTRCDVDF